MSGVEQQKSQQQQQIMLRFATDLKSKHEGVRNKAAKDLYTYVSTELREVSQEELNTFLDDFNHHIFEMVSGDTNSKMGGILAIVALMNADVCNTGTRISRFGNYLRNNCLAQANSLDLAVIELATKAIARLTQVSGTYTANLKFDFIDHEVKKAFEWLSAPERNEGRRHAAVLVLREIAYCMPTFFFQNVQQFFDVIFNAIHDSKPQLRESAVNSLRMALVVTSQRETSSQARGGGGHQSWYSHCFNEALAGLEENGAKGSVREDKIHGSLLVLSELLRCSNADWEVVNRELEDLSGGSPPVEEQRQAYFSMGAVKRQYRQLAGSKRGTTTTPAIPFNWFGSVAVGREPVYQSMACKALIAERFGQLCDQVLAVSRNTQLCKNPHIQAALITCLPRLAAANRQVFMAKHLEETLAYTFRCLQGRERDRYNALMAIGLLGVAARGEITRYLPNILHTLKQCLPQKESPSKRRSAALDPAIFACISFLARAVKSVIRAEVQQMLEPMLAVGLSPALTSSLRELAVHLPSLKREIADGLLKILSLILMQQPFRHPGTPKHLISATPSGLEPPDSQSVVLGLKTLGSFDFEGHSLLQFVRHCADTYLHSEEKEIRLEAVKTCSSLLRSALQGAAGRKSPTVMSTINEVLAKLLITGITDSDPDVRLSVLDCLNDFPAIDFHLAQAENISALFIAMNDEEFMIRELAICIIGRLSILNPAYIMPSLRVTLMQLLIELEHSGMGRNKEQASRLLGHLVANAPKLIRSYVEPILKVLFPLSKYL